MTLEVQSSDVSWAKGLADKEIVVIVPDDATSRKQAYPYLKSGDRILALLLDTLHRESGEYLADHADMRKSTCLDAHGFVSPSVPFRYGRRLERTLAHTSSFRMWKPWEISRFCNSSSILRKS